MVQLKKLLGCHFLHLTIVRHQSVDLTLNIGRLSIDACCYTSAAELHQLPNTITNVLPAIMEDSGKSLPPVPICALRDFTALVLL